MNSAGLKQRVPWQAKILAKLTLARLPVSYRTWTRLGVFRHGAMDDPGYAISVVDRHLSLAGIELGRPFTALELGPGDSVASALVAAARGATTTYLVDVGRFAVDDVEAYRPLIERLRSAGAVLPDVDGAASIDELCERVGARYLTHGLDSLRAIGSGTVDVVWSQAVLEHVRAADFDSVQVELRRVLAPDGVATHRVDFQDHLAESLNNLRFDDRTWERPIVWTSGFYTNRLRLNEVLASMRRAGFDTDVVGCDRWDTLPVPRARLAARFRGMNDDDLLVRDVDLLARPR